MLDDRTPLVGHVLMTADALGGVWTYALELATHLARLGVRTTLATMGEPLGPLQRAATARVPLLTVVEGKFKLEWMEDPWQDVSVAGDWLLALEERDRPDVVHLNGYVHAALDWRAPKVVVGHSCVLSWWKAVLGEPAPKKYARYRREVARGLDAADAIVTPTRAMLRALREHYGAALRGSVIPNGVDARRLAVAEKEPFVLAAGRLWDQGKNLRVLARAARQLTWPVYVAGSSASPKGAPGSAFAPSDGLRAMGWLVPEELHRWMARAAIYAFPARYEPFGLSVLEAALCGCALVLGEIASLREVWGEAALYVPPDDVGALVAAIERIAGDDALRARMASMARRRGLRLSAERMAWRYRRLYQGLLSRRSGRSDARLVAGRGPRPVHTSGGRGAGVPCA